jgi:predicted O-methyltransferase YrrM
MHRLEGTPDEIGAVLADWRPDAAEALLAARALVPASKREVLAHEAALLYALAIRYDHEGARILEIGTALGYSAAVLALAAPKASIVTLNPKPGEYEQAVSNLAALGNVLAVQQHSWDYLARYTGPSLDMVFVDGAHDQVERDLAWFGWLKVGGLMLYHDYSPAESRRPCPHVYEVVRQFGATLGREPDVLVVDSRLRGMAGWYRRDSENWPRG